MCLQKVNTVWELAAIIKTILILYSLKFEENRGAPRMTKESGPPR